MRFELINCKCCGLEVRRKRLAQRYCSERCRNASVQQRKRARGNSSRPLGHPRRCGGARKIRGGYPST